MSVGRNVTTFVFAPRLIGRCFLNWEHERPHHPWVENIWNSLLEYCEQTSRKEQLSGDPAYELSSSFVREVEEIVESEEEVWSEDEPQKPTVEGKTTVLDPEAPRTSMECETPVLESKKSEEDQVGRDATASEPTQTFTHSVHDATASISEEEHTKARKLAT